MMTKKFVDCFMLMGTALSLRGGHKLPDMDRPTLKDLTTTKVNVSLSLQEIRIVDNGDMKIEIIGLLNQKWVDARLGANIKTRKMAVASQIWKPKIVNVNGENSMGGNEDLVFWRGFGEDGNVLLSEKIDVKVVCTSNYRQFPFDVQMCQIKFGTFRFPQEEVTVVWDSVALVATADLNFNEYNLTNIVTYVETDIRLSGNFSIAVVQFTFKRFSRHYTQRFMLPSFLLTMINYMPFWFSLNRRSTRFYTNIIIFIFMLQFNYISVCSLHPTPYLKSIDIFVLVCVFFSLVTLLETIFVDIICTSEETHFHLKKVASLKEYPRSVLWSEYVMRSSYPVFYIFFIILYGWLHN